MVVFDSPLDRVVGVDDRGVISSTESVADRRKRAAGQLTREIHRDLSREHDAARTFLGQQVAQSDSVMLAYEALDGLDTDGGPVTEKVVKHMPREVYGDRRFRKRCKGRQAGQAPFELANIRVDLGGQMDGDVPGKLETVDLGFLLQNRNTSFHVRRLKVCDQSPFEAVAKALFESRNVLGDRIRREDDLAVGFVESVEGVKELLLGSLSIRQELNIVDDQNVDLAKRRLEFVHAIATKRCDQLGHEGFRAEVGYAGFRISFESGVTNGVREVGLSEPNAPVEKQRIVVVSWLCRDRLARGVGKLVARPDDEGREGVPGH